MAGFEYGEELICAEKVIIDSTAYMPGEDFPYQGMAISMGLVEQLLKSRKVMRKSVVTPAMMKQITRDRSPKVIKNDFKTGERIAVSWPQGEPLPPGVVDGRRVPTPVPEEVNQIEEEALEEQPPDDFPNVVELVPYGSGWYDVTVNGNVVNEKKLRKRDALKLKRNYEA